MFPWCAVWIDFILKLGAEGEVHSCPCIVYGLASKAIL